jgi:hypothetical protein
MLAVNLFPPGSLHPLNTYNFCFFALARRMFTVPGFTGDGENQEEPTVDV